MTDYYTALAESAEGPTTGHPAAGKLQEIAEDLEQDSVAWREWDVYDSSALEWIEPYALGVLLVIAANDPDRVRRHPRPHRGEWVKAYKCGGCGAGIISDDNGSEETCPECGHAAPIEEQ
jgi:rubrerythrin